MKIMLLHQAFNVFVFQSTSFISQQLTQGKNFNPLDYMVNQTTYLTEFTIIPAI